MFTISKWIQEYALVAYGLDANQRQDVLREGNVRESIAGQLSEAQINAIRAFNQLPVALKLNDNDAAVKAIQASGFLSMFESAIRAKFNECYRAGIAKTVKQANTDMA